MDSIVHFEIPADDPKRASKFYSDVFGWQVQAMEGFPYWSLITTELDSSNRMPKNPGAINGGMGKRTGPLKSIVITVSVKDIDKALKTVESKGGKIVQRSSPSATWASLAISRTAKGTSWACGKTRAECKDRQYIARALPDL